MANRGQRFACTPSSGTARIWSELAKTQPIFGYGQLDVFRREAESRGGASAFRRIRVDDVRECVFAVTRSPSLKNYGELAVFAGQLRFFLPPIIPAARAHSASSRNSTQKASGKLPRSLTKPRRSSNQAALAEDDGVAFFVQFPDPNDAFRLIQERRGHIVPVIDRTILAQEVDGQRIYLLRKPRSRTRSGWPPVAPLSPLARHWSVHRNQ